MFTKADCSKHLQIENWSLSCQRWSLHQYTWLSNIAFHLRPIWLQTLVAIYSESCLTSFPSFCTLPSEVAVLFNSNLSRRPFLEQVIDLDQFRTCCFVPMSYFYSETIAQPMTDRKIERSNGHCFGLQQLFANSIEVFISHEKKSDQ